MKVIKKLSVVVGLGLIGSAGCSAVVESQKMDQASKVQQVEFIVVDKQAYTDKLKGFWLGQCIANWTGLVTEMDKIGGVGVHGEFYTRSDWRQADQPSIWGQGLASDLSPTIDWVLQVPGTPWGSDDDTDIEFIYQHLLLKHQATVLTPAQITDGWLTHIYSDADTPFINEQGEPENYLWVSNQQAFDLMSQGMLPPDTSKPENNPHNDMIDGQLTTEIFGVLSPTNPSMALQMAQLPIRTVASGEAAAIAEFYVIMHALASLVDTSISQAEQTQWLAQEARKHLPVGGYAADMYDFVWRQYQQGITWETVRDQLYQRYQVEQTAGYDITARNLYCNGCFAAGINFAASLVSWFYGQGDFKTTVQLAVLMGWDSDNPAATWGGLLGFMYGDSAIRSGFEQPMSAQFNIHRTRKGFANNGIYTFTQLAQQGLSVVDRVVAEQLKGKVTDRYWKIPLSK